MISLANSIREIATAQSLIPLPNEEYYCTEAFRGPYERLDHIKPFDQRMFLLFVACTLDGGQPPVASKKEPMNKVHAFKMVQDWSNEDADSVEIVRRTEQYHGIV